MTPREFVIWLRGFTQAANNFSATPKQWDDLKEQLDKVEIDSIPSSVTVSNGQVTNFTYGRPEDSITYTTN
jgi:hypothetical protein